MKRLNYIALKEFCIHYDIDELFIIKLQEFTLIEIKVLNDQQYILHEELPKLERMVRMRQELGINVEGIEAVHHLLNKIERLQQHLNYLQNRLDPIDNA